MQYTQHGGAPSAGVTWCNEQRRTRLPLLGAPAVTSRRRRTTHTRTWKTRPSGARAVPHSPRVGGPRHNPFSRKSRSSGGQSGRSPSPIPCPCHGPKASRVIQTPGREFDSRRLFLILSGAHGRWPRATGHRSSTANHRARRRHTSTHGPRGRGGADTRRRDAGANPAGPGTIPPVTGRGPLATSLSASHSRCGPTREGYLVLLGFESRLAHVTPLHSSGSPHLGYPCQWKPWPGSQGRDALPHLLENAVVGCR